jgi:sugar lactone lactonase YvrE
VDNNGNVFVAEYIGGRVQVFDSTGKFKTQCLIDPQAATPSIAADRTGSLYVLQAVTITKYDAATCQELAVFSPALGSSYDDIAIGADGTLFVTMTGNQKDSIVRLDADGRATVVVDNAIGGQLGRPELDPKLAVDGAGNFYVLGSFASQLFKFDRTGKFLDSLGGRGSEPGQFNAVHSLAIDPQGRIYVSDSKGVQVFSPDGRYLDVFKVPKSVASGMAFDDDENLWVAAREQVYQMSIDRE